MWDYTKKVKDFFLKPKNIGEIINADAIGEVGSIFCGDALKLSLKIDQKTKTITDAKFQTFGCASAIASSSVLTEMIKGKTIKEVKKITNQDIADFLGGLPKEKMHCSVMAREALQKAIENYLYPNKKEKKFKTEKIICKCFNISEEKINKIIIENKLTTVEQITDYTKAGGGCGGCIPDIESILYNIEGKKHIKSTNQNKILQKKMTNLQRIKLIQDVINNEIKPMLQADGGNLELLDIEGTKVIVALRAMCIDCPMGGITIESIQNRLREIVDENIVVVEEL